MLLDADKIYNFRSRTNQASRDTFLQMHPVYHECSGHSKCAILSLWILNMLLLKVHKQDMYQIFGQSDRYERDKDTDVFLAFLDRCMKLKTPSWSSNERLGTNSSSDLVPWSGTCNCVHQIVSFSSNTWKPQNVKENIWPVSVWTRSENANFAWMYVELIQCCRTVPLYTVYTDRWTMWRTENWNIKAILITTNTFYGMVEVRWWASWHRWQQTLQVLVLRLKLRSALTDNVSWRSWAVACSR